MMRRPPRPPVFPDTTLFRSRGQAGADVEELPDAHLAGEERDRPRLERPGVAGRPHDAREDADHLVADGAVDLEVVLAAEPVVPDPRGVRHAGVDLRHTPGRGPACRRASGGVVSTRSESPHRSRAFPSPPPT